MGLEKDAINDVIAALTRVRRAAALCRGRSGAVTAKIDAELKQAQGRAAADHAKAIQAGETARQQTVAQAERVFLDRVQHEVRDPIAHATKVLGPLAAPWNDAAWGRYTPDGGPPRFPGAIRIGALTWNGGGVTGNAPAMLPLLGSRSVLIRGDGAGVDRALAALQATALRLVATFPPGTFRLTLIDPVGVGQNLKAFLRLPAAIRRDKIYSETREIDEEVRRLLHHVETVTQTRLLDFASIEQYNAKVEEVSVPYQFLIVANYPAGFNESAAAALLSLLQNGPRTGTYVLASIDGRLPPVRNVDHAALAAHCTVVTAGPKDVRWNDPLFAAYPITLDTPPPVELTNRLLDVSGAASERFTGTGIPFAKIAVPPERRWQGASANGLFVDIGVDSAGKVHQFELGSEVVHHGLIGGATRMGKTNLLHVLLGQLAATYPPSELELYLIDFKEGVEFQEYVTHALPQARVITIAREPEFGLSVLAALQREITRRGELFRQTGSTTIKEYRTATSKRLARILLVMDEYQILFGDDGAHSLSPAANAALADIVRRGAAFGIHVLLSSQSPASSFTSNRAAMNQLALRISLRCPEADARLILGDQNDAAKLLERPGEAIYNAGNGLPERNVFLQVARLEPDERKRRLQELTALSNQPHWKSEHPATPPVIFAANTPALLTANPEFTQHLADPHGGRPGTPLTIWLGEAIDIKPHTAATLDRRSRANLLIAGQDEETGHALLAAALLGLCAQRPPGKLQAIVLGFGRTGQPWSTIFLSTATSLPGYGVELVLPGNAGAVVERIAGQIAERKNDAAAPDTILIIAGLDRFDALRDTDKYGNPGPCAAALLTILGDGPSVGIHTLAWTAVYSPVERVLRKQGAQTFGLQVGLTMPNNEANIFLGGPEASRLPPGRGLFRDDAMGGFAPEKFKPYQLPTTAELTAIRQKLSVRTGG